MCYTYDLQNQLTSATYYDGEGDGDDHITKTYTYTYDTAGNLLTESVDGTVTKTYTYGNDQWNDLLTEYNGGKIAYEGQTFSQRDGMSEEQANVTGTPVSGNPISYYNGSRWTLEWEHGRNLTRSLFVSSNTPLISENKVDVENDLTYTYDADGIRTGRTYAVRIYRYAKNGDDGSVVASVGEAETNATYSRYLVSSSTTEHNYITQNGKVVRETIIKGGVTRVLDYIYDESGRPSSVIFKDGTADEVTYYYVLNLQGDVEKIIDANGVVQAIYSYDPWGKILSITSGTGASVNDTHIAKLNGLRYRGYHGDNETQWYYLQSRYYDPFTRRFVNADSYTSTGVGILGSNMFAYCNNNAMRYSDSSGQVIELAKDATEWEKEQYAKAVAHIKKSEVGRELIAKLESSDMVFTIKFEYTQGSNYQPSSRTIFFDATRGVVMKDGISVQSPALGLAHEMGHAAMHLDGESDAFIAGDRSQSLRLELENRNLQMYETPIAKQLGEPYRNDYDDLGYKGMKNPTHFITKGTRSWWYYLLPWNWGKSRTYAIHHNVK